MKNILVTGADGFIGSHLSELLLEKNYNVRALVQYNSFGSWGWLEDSKYKNELDIVAGDVRDHGFCLKVTQDIDAVFHLAALIAIPFSYIAPKSYIDTNIIGTFNICEASRLNYVKQVIHTSTSEVYGTAEYVPIDESHPLKPQSPYSASKVGADSMALSFYFSYGLPLTIARPFNVYGPRQSARAVIPTIISQLLNNSNQVKLGEVTTTRDFNYVIDTCGALISMLDKDSTFGKVINIGSGTEISIKDTFDLINQNLGGKGILLTDENRLRPKNSEVFRLCCDNKLLKEITGFTPKYTFEKGIKETIEWMSKANNLKQYKSHIYNV